MVFCIVISRVGISSNDSCHCELPASAQIMCRCRLGVVLDLPVNTPIKFTSTTKRVKTQDNISHVPLWLTSVVLLSFSPKILNCAVDSHKTQTQNCDLDNCHSGFDIKETTWCGCLSLLLGQVEA